MTTDVITGSIDRIDRLPSGGIEVIDYKIAASLQPSIYALACRDARSLGAPERAMLYFAESALRLSTARTDEQLDLALADVLARVSRMHAGEFAATPGGVRVVRLRAHVPECDRMKQTYGLLSSTANGQHGKWAGGNERVV